MKYYVETVLGLHKVKSFKTEVLELITNKRMNKLEDSGRITGYCCGRECKLLSKYSSCEVDTGDLDVHYIKNSVLNCQLDLNLKLKHKFGASVFFISAAKDLTCLNYAIDFKLGTDMALVVEYLHEIGLVDFDFLVYVAKGGAAYYYYDLRIKISSKYADAIINDLAKQRLGDREDTARSDITEKYTGLILGITIDKSDFGFAELVAEKYWSMVEEAKRWHK